MSPEQENLKRWLKEGIKINATHIIDVCDTFDYTHYPVYVMEDEDLEVIKRKYDTLRLQKIGNTYLISDYEEKS